MKDNEDPKAAITRKIEGFRKELHSLIDSRISELQNSIITCKHCGQLTIGDRSGRREYCCDSCRTLAGRKK